MVNRIDIGIMAAILVVGLAVGAIILTGQDDGNNKTISDDVHVKVVDELVEGDFNTFRVNWSDDSGEGSYEWKESVMAIEGNDCLIDCYRNGSYEYIKTDTPSNFIAKYSANPQRLAELMKDEGFGDVTFKKLKSVSCETYRGTVTCDMYSAAVNYEDDTTTRVGDIVAYIGPLDIVYRLTYMIKETNPDGSNTRAQDTVVIGSSLLVEKE